MTRVHVSGLLVYDADATLQHVDPTAASLLDASPDALFDERAEPLQCPLDTAEGASYASVFSLVEHLLTNGGPSEPILLATEPWHTARVTYGPDGPHGVVLTVTQSPSGPSASSSVSASHSGQPLRLHSIQKPLLERIAAGAALSDVLRSLILSIEDECRGMRGSVLLHDPDTRTLHHGAAPNLPDPYIEAIDGVEIGPSAGSCGTAAYVDDIVIAEDIDRDDRWARFRDVALAHDLRACWSVPIHGEEGDVLGTFAMYYDAPRTPTARDRTLIDEASSLASIAIEHDRQKRELEIQKHQFQRLVENAQPIVFLLDADGTLLVSEGDDLSTLGVEPGEHVGQSVFDLYDEYPTMLGHLERALSGETVDDVLEMDGAIFDVWYGPYYDRSGEVAGCLGMAADVTERREAEAALRANRDLLRRTQKMAHVGGWTYDPASDVLTGTEETYRIYEVPPNANLSLEESLRFYDPDTASTLRDAAQRCLTHGESFEVEGPLTTPEGTSRWVQVQGEARWADGEVTRMVGTVQDLTKHHEIEQRLREQSAWLRSITDNVSGGIYRSTKDGLVYANQAFLDLFGYDSLEEMSEADPRSFYVNPDVRASLLRREAEQGGLDGVEVEYRRKDGSTFTGLLRSTQGTGEDGTTYFDGVVTDISEQKAREQTIRAQRQKIEAVYGPSGRLLQAGSREEVARILVDLVHESFGYPGVVVRMVEDGELVPVHQSLSPAAQEVESAPVSCSGSSLVAEMYRAGEPQVFDDVRALNVAPNVGRARAVAGIPLGEQGLLTIASFEAAGIDEFDCRLFEILVQKATSVLTRLARERQLRASEARFRGLFEEAALGIALVNPEGQIVDANSELASMLGYARESLQGRHFSTVTHPDDRAPDRSLFREIVTGERARYELEKRYRRKDGDTFWARLTVSKHKGPGEAELIRMVEDVSNRKAYEQQLKEAKQEAEEASRLKSALLANMSHEIRTPLTSIIGFADMLRENLSGEEARYAEMAHQSGERLMDTLNSVLQLSKLEAGISTPSSQSTDLVAVVQDAVQLHRPQATSAQVELHFEPAVEELPGTWAATAVRRILSNLISNALKFTPEGGMVTVRVEAEDEHVVLEVSDTGIGISDEFRSRLFDAFTQESEGLKREHEGGGLGLAIVKRLVHLLEGEIEVDSQKGVGTCFTVRLPR